MDKGTLSERDICAKHITPALQRAGWDLQTQIREEVSFNVGWVIVKGRLHTRGRQRRADYLLSYRPNQPIAVIEANDGSHGVGDGLLFHDRTGLGGPTETPLALDELPSPETLLAKDEQQQAEIQELRDQLKTILGESLTHHAD